jgi:AbiTii-like protein
LPEEIRDVVGEEVPLGQGIGEIEAMAERAKASGGSLQLTVPDAQIVVRLMNHEWDVPGQQITEIYWGLNETAIRGVLDQVRTSLVELTAELVASMAEDEDTPTPAAAAQALNVVVGGKARVNFSAAQAGGSGSHEVMAAQMPSRGNESRWRTIGGFVTGAAILVGTLVAIAAWQGWNPF